MKSTRGSQSGITKGCTRSTHSGGCDVVRLLFVPGEPRRYPAEESRIKIRLTTLLLLIALAAVACAWIVERNFDSRVVGKWYYPTPETRAAGHSSELSIRADYSFSLILSGPSQSRTFTGTWRLIETGEFVFHVTRRKDCFFMLDSKREVETETEIDVQMQCRCSVDSGGYLLTYETVQLPVGPLDPSHLSFESVYSRLK